MRILYEDSAVAVCEKPVGISAQATAGGEDLPAMLRRETGAAEIFPVHRLDIATGGVMVYAKTKAAAAVLGGQIQSGEFQKTYLCAAHGVLLPPAGTLEDLLFHDRAKNKTYVVKRERKGVKRAKLAYETLAAQDTAAGTLSLLRVRLFTGRTHQIRVQLASRRHPLAGDGKYGAADAFSAPALYSCALAFAHPETGEALRFSLTPPQTAPWTFFANVLFPEKAEEPAPPPQS